MGTCLADCIAWKDPVTGKTTALATSACGAAACARLTPIMHQDAAISDTAEMPVEDGETLAPLCAHHANKYAAARKPIRCAVEGCLEAYEVAHAGVQLCAAHGAPFSNLVRKPPKGVESEEGGGGAKARSTTPTKSALYEVWLPGSDQNGGHTGNYYRFLGRRQSDSTRTVLRVFVPAAARSYPCEIADVGPHEQAQRADILSRRPQAYACRWSRSAYSWHVVQFACIPGPWSSWLTFVLHSGSMRPVC